MLFPIDNSKINSHDFEFDCTVKLVYNDHLRDPKIVAVVVRWSLFRGHLHSKNSKWDPKMLVAGGCYSELVVNSGLTVFTYCLSN